MEPEQPKPSAESLVLPATAKAVERLEAQVKAQGETIAEQTQRIAALEKRLEKPSGPAPKRKLLDRLFEAKGDRE